MAEYSAKITWRSDSLETFSRNQYPRGHRWSFDGGITIPASSSPHVVPRFSIEEAVDPEEALVAAAASCHMLTFLYLAAKAGFKIASYTDDAIGEMETMADGRQWISTIMLDPQIEWAGERIPSRDEIFDLHHRAHGECFIANSVRSEIVVKGFEA